MLIQRLPLPVGKQRKSLLIPVWIVFYKFDVQLLLIVQHNEALRKCPLCLCDQIGAAVVVAHTAHRLFLPQVAQENILFRCKSANIIGKNCRRFLASAEPLRILPCHQRRIFVVLTNILRSSKHDPIRRVKAEALTLGFLVKSLQTSRRLRK